MKKLLCFGAASVIFYTAVTVAYAEPLDTLLPFDHIFDTLSVDLKVNGGDGPVSLAVGDRITISWTSDGALRCKGNWSKRDLPLTGKISGTLNRSLIGSVIVRFACLDADGNRKDDSVVLTIFNPSAVNTPLAPQPPSVPLPSTDQPTVVSSCVEITKPGKYILQNDLTSPDKPCITIHNVSGVNLDCKNHMITGKDENYSLFVHDTLNFKVANCKLISDRIVPIDGPVQHVFRIEDTKNGMVENSVFGGTFSSIKSSADIVVQNSNFTNQFSIYQSTGIRIEKNNFSSKSPVSLQFDSGSDNTAISNTINGQSDGIFVNHAGADDGIVVRNESRDVIQDNFIQNIYDCGIENAEHLFDSKIIGNRLKNSGGCVIGGWYWSSVKGNMIKDNTGDNVEELFLYFRDYALKAGETEVYFKDNVFDGNKLLNPREGAVVNSRASQITFDAAKVPASSLVLGNNVFRNNDFTTVLRPINFVPSFMIVDGGGNICPHSDEKDYPLACGRGN